MRTARQVWARSRCRSRTPASSPSPRVEDLTEREWDLNLDVNTKGVFLCCQEAIRRFRASGTKGRLINTASGQARQGFIFTPALRRIEIRRCRPDPKPGEGSRARRHHRQRHLPRHHPYRHVGLQRPRLGTDAGRLRTGRIDGGMGAGHPDGARRNAGRGWRASSRSSRQQDAAYITGQTINVDGGLIMS